MENQEIEEKENPTYKELLDQNKRLKAIIAQYKKQDPERLVSAWVNSISDMELKMLTEFALKLKD